MLCVECRVLGMGVRWGSESMVRAWGGEACEVDWLELGTALANEGRRQCATGWCLGFSWLSLHLTSSIREAWQQTHPAEGTISQAQGTFLQRSLHTSPSTRPPLQAPHPSSGSLSSSLARPVQQSSLAGERFARLHPHRRLW